MTKAPKTKRTKKLAPTAPIKHAGPQVFVDATKNKNLFFYKLQSRKYFSSS